MKSISTATGRHEVDMKSTSTATEKWQEILAIDKTVFFNRNDNNLIRTSFYNFRQAKHNNNILIVKFLSFRKKSIRIEEKFVR